MKLVDLLAQYSRGEPVSFAVLLVASLSEAGVRLTPGEADSLSATITRLMTLVLGMYLARRHTTSYANPAEPRRGRRPVITFAGKREV